MGRGLISGIAQHSHLQDPWNFLKKLAFSWRGSIAFYKEIIQFDPDGIIMRELPDTERIISLGKPIVTSPINVRSFGGDANITEDYEARGIYSRQTTAGWTIIEQLYPSNP